VFIVQAKTVQALRTDREWISSLRREAEKEFAAGGTVAVIALQGDTDPMLIRGRPLRFTSMEEMEIWIQRGLPLF